MGSRPQAVDQGRQLRAGRKLATALTVSADKIGIAEFANGVLPVRLPASPQIAAGESAEHRRTTGMGALALQGIENLFNAISHDDISQNCPPKQKGDDRSSPHVAAL
jgi:hypothetical protein